MRWLHLRDVDTEVSRPDLTMLTTMHQDLLSDLHRLEVLVFLFLKLLAVEVS